MRYSFPMSADANREGLRILRKNPALFFMELLWRWSFGLGLLALTFLAYSHLRQAILLTDADEQALSAQDPIALATAAANLITPVLPLLVRVCTQVFSIAAVLWVAAATLGRGLITRIIVGQFATGYGVPIAADAPRWVSFALLNFARVMMLSILVIGYLGGTFVAGLVGGWASSLLLPATIQFCSLAISFVLWSYVNWVLSLAPIFVARDALAPLDATVEAIAFIRRHRSRLSAIAVWNSTLRGAAATVISLAGIFTAAASSSLPASAVSVLLVIETLAYFLISDFLLLARLGDYASVAIHELTLRAELPTS